MSKAYIVYRLPETGATHKAIDAYKERLLPLKNDEMVVRIKAVAFNYRDIAVETGKNPFKSENGPVCCFDARGEVVSIGPKSPIGGTVLANFNQSYLNVLPKCLLKLAVWEA